MRIWTRFLSILSEMLVSEEILKCKKNGNGDHVHKDQQNFTISGETLS